MPIRDDFIVYDSLDERSACDHFLGKDLEQAIRLFQESSLYYAQDLLWMGPRAFRYYIQAAIAYVESQNAVGDPDIVNCLAGTFELLLEQQQKEILQNAQSLESVCQYILNHWEKFDAAPQFYGDLHDRYIALHDLFSLIRSGKMAK